MSSSRLQIDICIDPVTIKSWGFQSILFQLTFDPKRNHRFHSCLLQHDFTHPHTISGDGYGLFQRRFNFIWFALDRFAGFSREKGCNRFLVFRFVAPVPFLVSIDSRCASIKRWWVPSPREFASVLCVPFEERRSDFRGFLLCKIVVVCVGMVCPRLEECERIRGRGREQCGGSLRRQYLVTSERARYPNRGQPLSPCRCWHDSSTPKGGKGKGRLRYCC